MKKMRGSRVGYPIVELDCGGRVTKLHSITNANKNDNFSSPLLPIELVCMYVHNLYLTCLANPNLNDRSWSTSLNSVIKLCVVRRYCKERGK